MKKTIFVSGGSKRIGKSICKYFHKNDFNIICHFNNSEKEAENLKDQLNTCLLYTSPSPRDTLLSRMPSSA